MRSLWWDTVSSAASDGGLAQRIVELLSPTVRQHINLMNSAGVIVASTDKDRIGSEHRAALEVIRTGRPVIVERTVDGVSDRPGINLPLVVDDQVSGVIGVTGDPAEVESVATVVVLAVELLIEQEREHYSSFAVRGQVRDAMVALASTVQPLGGVEDQLASLGLGTGPWSLGVWAAREPRGHGSAASPEGAERIAATIVDRRGGRGWGPAVAVVWRGLLWVLARGAQQVPDLEHASTRRLVVQEIATVEALRSWAQDMTALGERVALLPTGEDDDPPLDLALAVARLPEPTLQRMSATVEVLSTSQRETVRAVAAATSMTDAARRLYLHRNTLMQRVHRIQALTGRDLRVPDHVASLRLSLLAQAITDRDSADHT